MENTENTAVQATETVSAPEQAERTERPERPERPQRPANRQRRRKVCTFCTERDAVIDYKNPAQLRKFISERGKILHRRATGTCAAHQRALNTAIKRARHIGLLPFMTE